MWSTCARWVHVQCVAPSANLWGYLGFHRLPYVEDPRAVMAWAGAWVAGARLGTRCGARGRVGDSGLTSEGCTRLGNSTSTGFVESTSIATTVDSALRLLLERATCGMRKGPHHDGLGPRSKVDVVELLHTQRTRPSPHHPRNDISCSQASSCEGKT